MKRLDSVQHGGLSASACAEGASKIQNVGDLSESLFWILFYPVENIFQVTRYPWHKVARPGRGYCDGEDKEGFIAGIWGASWRRIVTECFLLQHMGKAEIEE